MDRDGKKRMARRVLNQVLPIERGFRAAEVSEWLAVSTQADPKHDGKGSPKFWYPDVRRVEAILGSLVRAGILKKRRERTVVIYSVARWWTY